MTRLVERVHATGHEHVTAEHASTFEVTSDDWLTPAGDCILAIEADTVPTEFDPEFVAACQDADAEIVATITVGEQTETFQGRGDPDLTFESDRSIVCRTSEYVDDRTVALGMDGAAAHVDEAIVAALAEGADLELTLAVEA